MSWPLDAMSTMMVVPLRLADSIAVEKIAVTATAAVVDRQRLQPRRNELRPPRGEYCNDVDRTGSFTYFCNKRTILNDPRPISDFIYKK